MDSIIGVVVALIVSALIGAGYYVYENSQLTYTTSKVLALKEAKSLVTFTEAFNAYVQNNQANISAVNSNSSPLVVTAAMMNLAPAEGTDALGQSLEGLVSTPYGQSLSWIVIPASPGDVSYTSPTGQVEEATTQDILKKYGLNAPEKAERFWGEVSADIVKISSGKINGYVYNSINQSFVPDLSGSLIAPDQPSPNYNAAAANNTGVWDSLLNYFPNQGVPYPQQVPQPYAPSQFSILASSALSKSPGYWVWAMNLYNNWSSGEPFVSMDFYSVGYSPGCPAGGLTPQVFNGASPSWPGNAQMDSTPTDPAMGQNYMAAYICLPISLTTYTQIAQNFNYSSACDTDSLGCGAYSDSNGDQIGYTASCSGSACQNENEADGEGYNPGNDGTSQGEGTSQSYWVQNDQVYQNEADYLYGSYLIKMPGGFEYSILWSSGSNFDFGGDWAFFGNQIGLFSGNVVNSSIYTVDPENGYPAYPWSFTTDGDPNNVSSSNNQNFTVLNLN